MATNKTLTPTNVTIQIPDFTDQPDQRINSNCLDKEADAINTLHTAIANVTDATSTGDILSSALTATGTKVFKGNGGSYTGTLPDSIFRYGTFLVTKRDSNIVVFAMAQSHIAINYYNGSVWAGWVQFADASSKSKINYIDITGSNSQIQVNSASGSVVSSANFISAYVVGNNSIVCLPYTYSGYVYVNLRSMSTMAEVGSGTYTVRVLYYS